MSYITTFTKKHFDPIAPQEELLDIADIAHALSLLCRANGHFGSFYSIAQHSINCMEEARHRGYSERVQLGCLLHDASEAYLSDITRPVKKELLHYLDIEKQLQDMIYQKWLGSEPTEPEREQISSVDDAMLYYEFKHFMDEALFKTPPSLQSVPDYSFADFSETERQFLRCFRRLTKAKRAYCTVGVDWKKPHWLAVEIDGEQVTSECFADIEALCRRYKDADAILIDIPIGLPESKEEAANRPDKTARACLPNGRKSSVFNVLFRQLVYADNKAQTWELSRQLDAGMTSVGYGLCAMIREVDEFLCKHPEMADKMRESHPEVAFQALNHGKGLASKHSENGIAERIGILKSYGINPFPVMAQYDNKAKDDVLDAVCLALSAQLGCENGFFTIPETPKRDSRNLPMQMVFGKTE